MPGPETPVVSVITIFLDAERFLEEAIESVIAQTFEDWELLLVDDGSTDGSAAIARRYVERDPARIRLFTHPDGANRGMSASRNRGMAEARGAYLAFLDADDVWLPTKLEHQVGLLRSHPTVGMVYGPAQWWYGWTGGAEDRRRDFVHGLGVAPDTELDPPHLVALFLREEGYSPCTCSVLVRREAAEAVGGFEEGFRDLYEDQAFFAKVALAAPVFASSACLARYRQHPRSSHAAGTGSPRYRVARASFLEWFEVYVNAAGVSDRRLRRVLRRERRRIRRSAASARVGRALVGWARRLLTAARGLAIRALSLPVLRHLRALQFRRLRPFGDGRLRGTPVVRHYWAEFVSAHRSDLRGRGLEIGSTHTLRRYGGGGLATLDAMDLEMHSPEVAVVADLSRADHVASDSYDCFVIPATAHVIHDIGAALYHALRILKPGGVLLIDFPCVDYYFPRGLDMGTGAPLFLHWWFTPINVENLLRRAGLDGADYRMEVYGNLFARIAYQLNLPAEELTRRELEHRDPGHPLLVCVRAVKPEGWEAEPPVYTDPWLPDVEPDRWNPETGHYAR
jgi:glycosyltransferase involved in cell wall biosynthesis